MNKQKPRVVFVYSFFRNEEIRTHDPIVPNDMRYQTALHSEYFFETKNEALECFLAPNRTQRTELRWVLLGTAHET